MSLLSSRMYEEKKWGGEDQARRDLWVKVNKSRSVRDKWNKFWSETVSYRGRGG